MDEQPCSVSNTEDNGFDIAPPNAASLVESLRALGYDLTTALADLADNSIYHRARNIDIRFHWAGSASIIALADDGEGMDEPTLLEAMRLGSRNPREPRDPRDLGRFGLGLKTASFSQCRRVTVFTWGASNTSLIRCWDIDHIAEVNDWRLLRTASSAATEFVKSLPARDHGTVVVWERLDRLTSNSRVDDDDAEDAFLRNAEEVRDHIAVVFHRLMNERPGVGFTLNDRAISPWDPFLAEEPATQVLPSERLTFQNQKVDVQPFVLPHLSKLDPETHRKAAGVRGWNAHQGFYIYRNLRLLVAGDWLGVKGWRQEEHYNLARIKVDLPNTLDHAWEIDVTKSRARPPELLKRELARIGERTRSLAMQVYSHRGTYLVSTTAEERVFLWLQTAKHGGVSHRINREHPFLHQVRAECADVTKFNTLLRMLEETVPISLKAITDQEKPDRTTAPFETTDAEETVDVMHKVYNALREKGLSGRDAFLRLSHMDPFQDFPELLQRLKEGSH